jgi:putative transposase
MHRTYHYRIYPSKSQIAALESQLGFNCDLYNAGLQERRDAWTKGVRVDLYAQGRQLTEVRRAGMAPEAMNAWTQFEALVRLDRAYQAFFRRCKTGEKPGYPRFRSKRRYDSLIWSFRGHAGGAALIDARLRLQGIGSVKLKLHRKLPQGASLKTVTVTRSCGHWHASFSLTVENVILVPSVAAIGIDLGITNFAALSTGRLINGPRSYRAAQSSLRVAQRRVSRRTRGSVRRRKAGLLVARTHEHVRNVRRDFQHKLSRRLVNEFGIIGVEALNIKGLAHSTLAKDISDQGWGEFLAMLNYKAEGAGSQILAVDPRNTSQECSGCEALVPKPLSCLVHSCPDCGLVLDRHVNAARVILKRALGSSVQASTVRSMSCAVA